MGLWTDSDSAKRFKKITDEAVEIFILFSEFFDLLDGVDDGRMVLSPETSTDLRQ